MEKTDLECTFAQKDFLARFDRYQLEGRYPEFWPSKVDVKRADKDFQQAKELFQWLIHQL